MTLIELMIATGVGSVVLAAVMALTLYSARSFAAVSNYVDLDVKSRYALDRMSQEIRQANGLTVCNSGNLVFSGTEPATGAAYTLTYTYDSGAKTLTRRKSTEAQAQTLLSQCNTLNWSMYQRNMTNGTDQPIPTTDVTQCKLIKLTWICSRDIFGKSVNTESVQSAEIVIRKK